MDEENLIPYKDKILMTKEGLFTENGNLIAKRRQPHPKIDSDWWKSKIDDLLYKKIANL